MSLGLDLDIGLRNNLASLHSRFGTKQEMYLVILHGSGSNGKTKLNGST